MLLTVDIGNTNIKTGIFVGNELQEFFTFSDDLSSFLEYILLKKVEKAAISSVVPDKTELLISFLSEHNIAHTIINADSHFRLNIKYDTPATLGIDRICSSEGAYILHTNNQNLQEYDFIVTIDFGTANTVNIISPAGDFIGGIIAPGIDLMLSSLSSGTAQLPETALKDYVSVIGTNTKGSIASGIINSISGLIYNVIFHLRAEQKAEGIYIYTTGGNYNRIKPYLTFPHIYEKALVHYGINSVFNNQ